MSGLNASVSPIASHRTLSLARRMLSGACTPSLLLYRENISLQPLTMCLIDENSVAFSLAARESADLEPGQIYEARVTLEKDALASHARITLASVHFLADITVLSASEKDRLLAGAHTSDQLKLAAQCGALIAVAHLERIIIHDVAGVTPLNTSHEITSAPAIEEYEAYSLATTLCPHTLASLCDLAILGTIKATVNTHIAPQISCASFAAMYSVIDLDEAGITLLRKHDTSLTTVHIPFPKPARNSEELYRAVQSLCLTTLPLPFE